MSLMTGFSNTMRHLEMNTCCSSIGNNPPVTVAPAGFAALLPHKTGVGGTRTQVTWGSLANGYNSD